jgi:hypothetical protein
LTYFYDEIKKSQEASKKRLMWLQSLGFENYLDYLRYQIKQITQKS